MNITVDAEVPTGFQANDLNSQATSDESSLQRQLAFPSSVLTLYAKHYRLSRNENQAWENMQECLDVFMQRLNAAEGTRISSPVPAVKDVLRIP
jgi:hypothetical protein